MKKGIVVLLIAVLVAGFVFADFSGTASFSAGYDLDEKEFSLDNSKAGKGTFKFDFEAQSGATEAAESGIYAEFSGSFTANVNESGVKTKLDLKDALIKSVDGLWSINLTKVANGVELTYDGNALDVYYTNKLTWGASVTTKAFEVAEGLTVSANAGYAVAKTDLTDPDNYYYGFDSATKYAISVAKNTETYFKQHDDGTYYNADLAAAQEAVADAEEALAEAKAAFAENPTIDNYEAIEDAEDYVAYFESVLSSEIAYQEYLFKKAYATGDDDAWYYAKTTYSPVKKGYYFSTSGYPLTDDEESTYDLSGELNAKFTGLGSSKKYYLVAAGTIAPAEGDAVGYAVLQKDYTVATNGTILGSFTSSSSGVIYVTYVAYGNQATTAYKDNEDIYEFTADEGTQTVNGGITVAYEADKIAASVAFNAQYEFLTYKAFGFDATAKAKYDFVEGTVKFERSLEAENLLDAEVSATLDELIGMPLSVKVGSTDILNKGDDGRVLYGELGLEVVGITLKGGATMKFGNDPHDTAVGRTTLNGEIGYAFDFLTIDAKATVYNEYYIVDHDYTAARIAVDPELTLSNTSLIKNAELSLAWAGAHFGGDADNKALGSVTATIGISF